MKTERFSYKGVEIEFTPTKSGDIMINATQMCSLFGKDVSDFLEIKTTEFYISALLDRALEVNESVVGNRNSGYQYHAHAIFAGIKTREDIVSVSRKHGTKIHRLLALKLASWLDPHFEVWVYETIDSLFFSEIRLQRDLVYQRLSAEAKQERDRLDLIAKYPEAAAYFENEKTMKEAGKGIKKSQSRMLGQFAIDFKDMQEQDK